MTALQAAGFWAGLHILLLIFLSFRVGGARLKHKVNLGDGDNEDVLKAIRTQGNYIEYAPLAMLGLILLALLQVSTIIIHIIGGGFLIARLSHFLGLGTNIWPLGRVVGILGTLLTLLILGGFLIFKSFT